MIDADYHASFKSSIGSISITHYNDSVYPERFRRVFVCFSAGLEEPEDIIRDMDQALSSAGL